MSLPTTGNDDLVGPIRLQSGHDVARFRCGENAIDYWLKRRARVNDEFGYSRTHVMCAEQRVVGFYALSADSLVRADLPNLPDHPLPSRISVVLLGQLGVDRRYTGRGLGRELFVDAIRQVIRAGSHVGVAGMVIDPLNDRNGDWYRGFGFVDLADNPGRLWLPVATLRDALPGVE